MFHSIKRTSPDGAEFVGTCTLCGKPGLKAEDAGEPCEAATGKVERKDRTFVLDLKTRTISISWGKD